MLPSRFQKYLVLIGSSLVVPFLVTMVLIIITGDRIYGMRNFGIPSAFIIHLIFTLFLDELSLSRKITYGLIGTIMAILLTSIPLAFQLKLNIDMYGFSDLIIYFTISSILVWEVLFLIKKDKKHIVFSFISKRISIYF